MMSGDLQGKKGLDDVLSDIVKLVEAQELVGFVLVVKHADGEVETFERSPERAPPI